MDRWNNELTTGMVVWAKRAPYYDRPWNVRGNDRSMYLIIRVEGDYFFGCPLVHADSSLRNSTILYHSDYPLRYDSRVNECIYKIPIGDIINSKYFTVEKKIFDYFQKKMYERIVLNEVEGIKEYNDLFADQYMASHKPKVNNIVIYPSIEKIFKNYYIYEEENSAYQLVKVNKIGKDNYQLADNQLMIMPKDIRYFGYYENTSIDRNEVKQLLKK